jgi:serine phosphatase RsbU (regulator of sigma subunit)
MFVFSSFQSSFYQIECSLFSLVIYHYIYYIKNIIYIILFLISFQGFAQFSLEQQQQVDSLNKIIASPKSHDTTVVLTYFELINYYYLSDPDTAIIICKKAEMISERLNYQHGKSESYAWLGYLNQGKGNIALSLEYSNKSLKNFREIGDKKATGTALGNIGFIYKEQGMLIEALDYYKLSIKLYEDIGYQQGLSSAFGNIGDIHEKQGKIIEALEYHNSSLKIDEEIGSKKGIATSLTRIGMIYYNQGKVKEALDYYIKSLTIQTQIGDKKGIAICLNNIGIIHNDKGELKEALEYGQKSLTISEEIGFPDNISQASSLLSEVYQKQGNGMKALEMYKLYIQMHDSIHSQEIQKAAAQQQAKHEYEKQRTIDDAENEKLLAIEQEEKEKQKILTAAIAIGLGLVVIFLVFVFNRLKATRKQKIEIEQQKEVVELAHDELEEKNQEIMDSIIYAKRIQSAILPPIKVVKEYLKESFILYRPKDVVAGDFYWMEQKNGKVLFAAADCTGHGVPGAMVSVVCNNGLNRSVREHGLTIPGEILDKTREIVVKEFKKSEEDVKDGMDIALCSIEGMKLQYAGAYNPLWIIRNGEIIETKANKQPIGQFDNPEPYTTHSFDLEKGDAIYIFSDGYVDQFGGERGKKFKAKAFRELLLSIQDKAMEEQKTTINETFETWKGDLEQIDDVCVIGVRV